MKRLLSAVCVFTMAAIVLVIVARTSSGRQDPEYNPRQVLRAPIRPIVNPEIVTADKADLSDNELVIGAVVNGEARAWPINQLTGPLREIINDTVGGIPVAATW